MELLLRVHKHRSEIERIFIFSIFSTLFLGALNVLTMNSLVLSRISVISLLLVLILGPVFLLLFKETVKAEITDHDFRFFFREKNLIVKLEDLKSYTISYPNNRIVRIIFRLRNANSHTFNIVTNSSDLGKPSNSSEGSVAEFVKRIQYNINEYNLSKGDNLIERRYSFFASKYGLISIIALTVVLFSFTLLKINNKAVNFGSLALSLSFIFMAIQQRRKERSDLTGY